MSLLNVWNAPISLGTRKAPTQCRAAFGRVAESEVGVLCLSGGGGLSALVPMCISSTVSIHLVLNVGGVLAKTCDGNVLATLRVKIFGPVGEICERVVGRCVRRAAKLFQSLLIVLTPWIQAAMPVLGARWCRRLVQTG